MVSLGHNELAGSSIVTKPLYDPKQSIWSKYALCFQKIFHKNIGLGKCALNMLLVVTMQNKLRYSPTLESSRTYFHVNCQKDQFKVLPHFQWLWMCMEDCFADKVKNKTKQQHTFLQVSCLSCSCFGIDRAYIHGKMNKCSKSTFNKFPTTSNQVTYDKFRLLSYSLSNRNYSEIYNHRHVYDLLHNMKKIITIMTLNHFVNHPCPKFYGCLVKPPSYMTCNNLSTHISQIKC